jgi:hypothetical protein
MIAARIQANMTMQPILVRGKIIHAEFTNAACLYEFTILRAFNNLNLQMSRNAQLIWEVKNSESL